MFCTQCGAEVEADDRFCWMCGTKLREHSILPNVPPSCDLGPNPTLADALRVQAHDFISTFDDSEEPKTGEAPDDNADPNVAVRRRIADALRRGEPIDPSWVKKSLDPAAEKVRVTIDNDGTIMISEPEAHNLWQDPDECYSWCGPCFYQRSFSLIQRDLERLGFAFVPEAEVCADGRATIVAHTAELSLPGEAKNAEERPRIAITLHVPHAPVNQASIPIGSLPGEARPSKTRVSYSISPNNDIVMPLKAVLECARLDNVETVTGTDGVVLERAARHLNELGCPQGITKRADRHSFTSYEQRYATVTVKGSSAACPHYEVQAEGHADRIAITLLFSEEQEQVKKPSR